MGTANTVMEPDLATMGLEFNIASQILGSKKVVSKEQAAKAWGLSVHQNPRVLYDKETLKQCAAENTKNLTDWRLVYINGLSLRGQRDIVGAYPQRLKGFSHQDWWMRTDQDSWTTNRTATGYTLIDFRGRFGDETWFRQEELIEALGEGYRRTHEAVIAEAIFTTFKVTNYQLLMDWLHWGLSQAFDGNRVYLGSFKTGLEVNGYYPNFSHKLLRVCVSRSFQY